MARLDVVRQDRLGVHQEIAEMVAQHLRLLQLVRYAQQEIVQLRVLVLVGVFLGLLMQLGDLVAHSNSPCLKRHPRSIAPVSLVAAATMRAATASISASVSVRSAGCSVTSTASDFIPGSMPCPV